jgi:hypothetical protein
LQNNLALGVLELKGTNSKDLESIWKYEMKDWLILAIVMT